MPKMNFPSSEELRDVEPFLFLMDGGGKHIVEQEIQKVLDSEGRCKILEVGLFVGGSAKRWLSYDTRCTLVGVDLFERNDSVFDGYFARNIDWATKQFSGRDSDAIIKSYKKYGQALTFFKNLENYSDRLDIYKGNFSGEVATIAHAHPDINVIFLDADKAEGLLNLCWEHFPNAVITGDDWTWGADKGYPMQRVVKEFCNQHGAKWANTGATWKIIPD